MDNDNTYSVGELAGLAHVSVRTLHHYDQISLLVPSSRSSAGYRQYSHDDVVRLQQILFYRGLEFSLDQIAALLNDPAEDVDAHLRRQHAVLRERIGHQQELLTALEKEMEARNMGIALTPEERFEVFGPDAEKYFDGEYATEAEQRWGDTDKWAQSQARTQQMTKEQWAEVKVEMETFEADLGAAVRAGTPVDGDAAAVLAERHRASIERYYDCSHEFQVCLAQMYLSDPRFTEHYEQIEPGTAQWLHDAIVANAARHAD